jgi:hypothetical protein
MNEFPQIGMSLPVNFQFNTGTAVKESRRLFMTSRDKEELLATLGVEEEIRHNYFLIHSSSVLFAGEELQR